MDGHDDGVRNAYVRVGSVCRASCIVYRVSSIDTRSGGMEGVGSRWIMDRGCYQKR